MKTLHLLLIMIFSASLVIANHGIFADNGNNVEIQNIQVQPTIVKIGDMFTVNATLVNNSSNTVYVGHGSCEAPFSVTFDNHVHVSKNNLNCTTEIILQKLDPGEKTLAKSPYIDLVYKAVESGNSSAIATLSYHKWDPTTQSDIEKSISKPFSFTIYDNKTSIVSHNYGAHPVINLIDPPLKQLKSGIHSQAVQCKQDFLLVIKSKDNHPACTTPRTALRLLDLGWGQIESPFETTADLLDSKISAGQIVGFHYDLQAKIILVKIQTTSDGNLTITIPRKLLDVKVHGHDDHFYVLLDGREIDFTETGKTDVVRTLTIQFLQDTKQIEVIGSPVGQS